MCQQLIQKYPKLFFKSGSFTNIINCVNCLTINDSLLLKVALELLQNSEFDYYNSVITFLLNTYFCIDEDVLDLIPNSHVKYYTLPDKVLNNNIITSGCGDNTWYRHKYDISANVALLHLIKRGRISDIYFLQLDDYRHELREAFRHRNKYLINIFKWISLYVWENIAKYIYLLDILIPELKHLIAYNLFI